MVAAALPRRLVVDSLAAVALLALLPVARAEEGAEEAAAAGAAEAARPAVVAASSEAYATLRDETLAYEFTYPTSTSDARQLSWVKTREPVKYSAAAPLSADARQRIVCELANFRGPLTMSLTVGPPPPVLELVGERSSWTARQVAVALLADRSTGRISSGQRVSLASLESLREAQVDGSRYLYVETVAQGSPSFVDPQATTYRHSLGVIAEREGYFYTLMASCPERLWPEVEPLFRSAVASFRLLPPTAAYRAPDTPALQFW